MAEEVVLPYPNLTLPQQFFLLSTPSLSSLHADARAKLLEGIKADQMAPYYRVVTAASALPVDAALLQELEAVNKAELDKLDERLAEAEKMEGDTDVVDLLKEKAMYLTRIGEKVCPSAIYWNRAESSAGRLWGRIGQPRHRILRWIRQSAPAQELISSSRSCG